MTIESELQAQLDFLRRPDTVWVGRAPIKPGEACMVMRAVDAIPWHEHLPRSAQIWLGEWMHQTFGGARGAPAWNDLFASGRGEVVERLEKAVAAAGEQGI